MLAHTDVSTLDADDRTVACVRERSLEAEVLMEAVTALHRAEILTDAEYEAKRRRLAAHL